MRVVLHEVDPGLMRSLQEKYQRLGSAALAPEPALRLIGEDIMEIIRTTIESGGRRGGGSWQNLADATVRRKAQGNYDPRPLFRTGAFFASLTEAGDPGHIFEVTPHSVTVGSNEPPHGGESDKTLGELHSEGTSRMPARPWCKMTHGDLERFEYIIRRYFWTAAFGGEGRMTREWLS